MSPEICCELERKLVGSNLDTLRAVPNRTVVVGWGKIDVLIDTAVPTALHSSRETVCIPKAFKEARQNYEMDCERRIMGTKGCIDV